MLKPFPRVKICGITRARDARLAASLGADYLGLITYPESPRRVTRKVARAIIDATQPTAQFVLVFVNEAPERIITLSRRLRSAIVQIHGAYSARDVTEIQKAGLRVMQAFQIGDIADVTKAAASRADFVLLDNKDSSGDAVYGGSGKAFDWSLLRGRAIRGRNLIIAGGLSVDNFATALELLKPLALDFNSGVESSPGIKSPLKLKRLFAALNKRRQNYVR